jgi:hypothetical protein
MSDFITNWEKEKKKGRLRYALIQGIIFGLVVTLIKDRKLIWELINGGESQLSIILINFCWIFIAATIGHYTLIWWWKERLYKKEVSQKVL